MVSVCDSVCTISLYCSIQYTYIYIYHSQYLLKLYGNWTALLPFTLKIPPTVIYSTLFVLFLLVSSRRVQPYTTSFPRTSNLYPIYAICMPCTNRLDSTTLAVYGLSRWRKWSLASYWPHMWMKELYIYNICVYVSIKDRCLIYKCVWQHAPKQPLSHCLLSYPPKRLTQTLSGPKTVQGSPVVGRFKGTCFSHPVHPRPGWTTVWTASLERMERTFSGAVSFAGGNSLFLLATSKK